MTERADLSRRVVLLAGGSTAVTGTVLFAGCAPGGGTDAPSSAPPESSDLPETTEPPDDGAGATTGAIAPLADIPVGGSVGLEIEGEPALLAQPAAGEVVAFSAICTHQGCVVAAAGDRFECPCHGSVYEAATGEVLQGPAQRPLTPIAVRVSADQVVLGG